MGLLEKAGQMQNEEEVKPAKKSKPKPVKAAKPAKKTKRKRTSKKKSDDLDDFEVIRKRTPHITDMKPGGKYVMLDLDEVGVVPSVLKSGDKIKAKSDTASSLKAIVSYIDAIST